MESSDPETRDAHPGRFATTRWSVVLAAHGDSPSRAHDALASLCQAYWYPLYAFARRQGYSSEDARDATQSFFVDLLDRQALERADPDRGRFRSFLLACMKNFLANERERRMAQKRGGGETFLSIDAGSAEERYLCEPADPRTPERLFDRRWALTLLERTLDRLADESATAGRGDQFERLRVYLTGEAGVPPYAEVAGALDMTEDAVKTAVHRLRRRYRKVLRDEIADTVADPGDIDDEIRALFAALET